MMQLPVYWDRECPPAPGFYRPGYPCPGLGPGLGMPYPGAPGTMPLTQHAHAYEGTTSVDHRHCHTYRGTTGPAIPMGMTHVHEYRGETSRARGHTHTYCGTTGPSIPLAEGGHAHLE
jgi:hypothetical protein